VSAELAGIEKDRFTSLDTLAVARELRALGRAHVDKAFDVAGGAFSLTLRAPSGRRELLLVPGRYAALLADPLDHPEEPGPLARELRRLLAGGVITDVPDPAGERYLEVVVRRGDSEEALTLAVELFGTGNLLVARGSRLVAVAHAKTWAHRTVRVGVEYVRPPSRGNPWEKTASEIEAAFGQSRTDRASTLAARLSFGGPIAEELLSRAGLVGAVPAPSDAGEAAQRLHRALTELLAEVGPQPSGYLYRRGDALLDVEPFRSHRWTGSPGVDEEHDPSFSHAAHRFFSSVAPAIRAVPPTPSEDRRSELARQRAQQVSALASLASEVDRLNRQAESIYAHYDEADRARLEAERTGEGDALDVSLGDLVVPILLRRPLEMSARALYEEAKRAQAKLEGARAALEETDRRIALPDASVAAAPAARPSNGEPATRPLWFERYRWFVSSEGVLVIGGRDAASNDLIVRKYLKAADLYVHADVHGAPSVVVKRSEPGSPAPTESTFVEAGQFGLAFSKAWRAGLASGSAFWVGADQVSKAGASGEFVARGAFVIHGSKNALRDVPVELAIGTIPLEGAERWCVGPPSALRARGQPRFLLTPGDERDRPEREVELSKALGVGRSRLQALLPAGGLTVRPT